MNIHPIFVHFPIALLFLYSLCKLLPVRRWFPTLDWSSIEKVLVVIGFVGVILSRVTGEWATEAGAVVINPALLDAHESFATIVTGVYAVLLVAELSAVVDTIFRKLPLLKKLDFIQKLVRFIAKTRWVMFVLALVGLFALCMTGILGGILVYGDNVDPVAKLLMPYFR